MHLRFLAKADFSEEGDIHGISKSSVCVVLAGVYRALDGFLATKFPADALTLLTMKRISQFMYAVINPMPSMFKE